MAPATPVDEARCFTVTRMGSITPEDESMRFALTRLG